MHRLNWNKSFILGFALGTLVFAGMNLYTALPNWSRLGICFDCYETYGFPFDMHESGTMLHLNEFIWSGVVANLAIAVLTSLLFGLLFKFVFAKITLPRQGLK